MNKKLEKECNYCNGSLKSIAKNIDLEIYLEEDKSLTINNFGYYEDLNFKINYCPMCGKKLNGE